MISQNTLSNIVLIFCFCLLLFIFIREIICWYWKINERISLQQKIFDEQCKTNGILNSIYQELEVINHKQTKDIQNITKDISNTPKVKLVLIDKVENWI